MTEMRNDQSGIAPQVGKSTAHLGQDKPVAITKAEISSRIWQLTTLLIPVLLGAYLTFVSRASEERITKDVAASTQMLSLQLRLTEELYKRRIDTYEDLYTKLKELEMQLQFQDLDNNSSSQAMARGDTADLLAKLDKTRGKNELYLSSQVSDLMGLAFETGAVEPEGLGPVILRVEKQMKEELQRTMKETANPEGSEHEK
jgi:hypothetical protein